MKNDKFSDIWVKLGKCKKVVMSLHAGPDGDSLGSCAAMKYVLERDFKSKVRLVSFDNLSSNMANLSYAKEVEFGTDISDVNFAEYDCVVFLDCGSIAMVSGRIREKLTPPKDVLKINIDHHISNNYFGDLNYIDAMQPSACSLLIDLFKSIGVKFDAELSNRLLLGVCTDSGFFTVDSDTNKSLLDAAFLVKNGADYRNNVLKPILHNQPLRLKKYIAYMVDSLKIDAKRKVGYAVADLKKIKELGLNDSEVRLAINELQLIEGIDVVFVLTETNDYIKGSLRSTKGFDVSLIAAELGGGGHKAASAFRLPKMSIKDAEKRVFDAIDKIKTT